MSCVLPLRSWPLWLALAGCTTRLVFESGGARDAAAGDAHTARAPAILARLDTSAGGAGVSEDVRDFPLLLRLGDDFPFAQLAPGGEDLEIADAGGRALSRQVAHWDAEGGAALVWVLVPLVHGDSDADYLRLTRAATLVAERPVFTAEAGFAAVWHLDEPDGSEHALDVAGEDNAGVLGETRSEAGMIGDGRRLWAPQNIPIAHHAELDLTGSFTISAWISLDTLSEERWYGILAKRASGIVTEDAPVAYSFFISPRDGVPNLSARIGTGARLWPDVQASLGAGRFHHVALSYDHTLEALRFFLDGEQLGAAVAHATAPVSDLRELSIGGEGGDDPIAGVVDEVRLASVAHSAAFVKLSYENQRSDGRLVRFEPE